MADLNTPPDVGPRHGSPARIVVTTTSERTIVAVSGDIDMAVTGRLAAQLAEVLSRDSRAVIVELTDVKFCSARGLAVLLEAVATARAEAIPIAVVTGSRAVLRPVEVLQLHHVLPLHLSLTDAEHWLAPPINAHECRFL